MKHICGGVLMILRFSKYFNLRFHNISGPDWKILRHSKHFWGVSLRCSGWEPFQISGEIRRKNGPSGRAGDRKWERTIRTMMVVLSHSWAVCGCLAYLAYSMALVSRMTFTLIWPGYSSSDSIFRAISRAMSTRRSSGTSSGFTMIRTSRPAWMA